MQVQRISWRGFLCYTAIKYLWDSRLDLHSEWLPSIAAPIWLSCQKRFLSDCVVTEFEQPQIGAGLIQLVFVARLLLNHKYIAIFTQHRCLAIWVHFPWFPRYHGRAHLPSQVHVFVCSPTNTAFPAHRLLWFYSISSSCCCKLWTLPSISSLFQLSLKLLQSPFLLVQSEVIANGPHKLVVDVDVEVIEAALRSKRRETAELLVVTVGQSSCFETEPPPQKAA